jgi:hypothetical protein
MNPAGFLFCSYYTTGTERSTAAKTGISRTAYPGYYMIGVKQETQRDPAGILPRKKNFEKVLTLHLTAMIPFL